MIRWKVVEQSLKTDIVQRTQLFSLPMYAIVHDTVAQSLKDTGISDQQIIDIMGALPKLSVKSNEQKELQNGNGAVELEDTFGSGSFYVIDAGSNEAYVFIEESTANYMMQILESSSQNQSQKSQQSSTSYQRRKSQSGERQGNQGVSEQQSSSNEGSKDQQNQSSGLDMLTQLQTLEMLTKTMEQTQQQQNPMDKLFLLQMLQKTDTNELLKNVQLLKLIEQLAGSGDSKQGNTKQSKQNQQQGGQQQQGQNEQHLLQELQLLKSLTQN